ncbi:MAG: hypothetical protein R3E79_31860 [Caldilineaceae bacterium]
MGVKSHSADHTLPRPGCQVARFPMLTAAYSMTGRSFTGTSAWCWMRLKRSSAPAAPDAQ